MARIADPGHPGYRPELEGVEDEYLGYVPGADIPTMRGEEAFGEIWGPGEVHRTPGSPADKLAKKKGSR